MGSDVKIKLEGGLPFDLTCDNPLMVLDDVFHLAKYGLMATTASLKFQIPAFVETHVLVSVKEHGPERSVWTIYGVKCGKGEFLSAEEAKDKVADTFDLGDSIREMDMTAFMFPCGSLVSGDGYPSGTLFAGREDSCSSSSSPPSSPPPWGSPRSVTASVTSAVFSGPMAATAAEVGESGYYQSELEEADDQSASAPCADFRNVLVQTTPMTLLLGPVQKLGGGKAGDVFELPGIELETPSKNLPSPIEEVPAICLQTETADEQSSPCPPKAPDKDKSYLLCQSLQVRPQSTSQEATVLKPTISGGNQMVIGLGCTKGSEAVVSLQTKKPPFSRCLSSPDDVVDGNKIRVPVRNTSDNCLVARDRVIDSDANGQCESAADTKVRFDLRTQVSPCNPTTVSPCKPTTLPISDDHLAKPQSCETNLPLLNASDNSVFSKTSQDPVIEESPAYMPTSPSKPVAIQCQENGKNEMVLAKDTFDARKKMLEVVPERSEHSAQLSFGNEIEKDPAPEDSKSIPRGVACGSVPNSSDSIVCEEQDEVMVQVHMLEHACNESCFWKDLCKNKKFSSLDFVSSVDQMKEMVRKAKDGFLGSCELDLLKVFILKHCRRCKDGDCKVPHIMAGCPSWRSCSTGGYETVPTDQRVGTVSFDLKGNDSTTSDVQRHMDGKFSPQLESFVPVQEPLEDMKLPFQQPYERPATSPLASGGFLPQLLNPVKVRHAQESYIDAEEGGVTNHQMHQVSDEGKIEKRPRAMGQFSFLEPSHGGLLEHMYSGSSKELMYVKEGEFPSFKHYSKTKRGTVIFSNKEKQNGSPLNPGSVYPYPNDVTNVPKEDKLGEGGNGKVIKYHLQNQEFALKQTSYRVAELNVWSKLSHDNILPLQAVMIGGSYDSHCNRGYCYQFMPKMTISLRETMRQTGDLCTLVSSKDNWDVVNDNILFIVQKILCGLKYLHSQDIQHCDMKASNILILKKCSCQDVYHCTCPVEEKYEIRIADFDSVKKTRSSRVASHLPVVKCVPKKEDLMDKVLGTPAYRAPEQFEQPINQAGFKKVLQEGQEACDLEGPWCDMWGVGVILLQLTLGSISKEDYNKASHLFYETCSKMKPRIEVALAMLRLNKFLSLSLKHPGLQDIANVAQTCLELDFKKRPDADKVLDTLPRIVQH